MKKKRRKQFTNRKKRLLIVSVFLAISIFLGIGYSYLYTNLNVLGDITVEKHYEPILYDVFRREYNEGEYQDVELYTGEHNDGYSITPTRKIYYWHAEDDIADTRINEKNNVIFANQCWKMIRTTDTGGVKLLYNGVPPCTGGTVHVGYDMTNMVICTNAYCLQQYRNALSSASYTVSNNTQIQLVNPVRGYGDLNRRYICINENYGTCINYGFVLYYETNYIAIVPLNTNNITPQSIGKAHYSDGNVKENLAAGVNYRYELWLGDSTIKYKAMVAQPTVNPPFSYTYFASSYTYENGMYNLSSDASIGYYSPDKHYSCTSAGGSCPTMQYVFFQSDNVPSNLVSDFSLPTNSGFYYINLTDGESIDDALNNMLSNDEAPIVGSVAEALVSNWYGNYLGQYSDYIEDTIYCNNRLISDYQGFDPSKSALGGMKFYSSTGGNSLLCQQAKDSFSVSNPHAPLEVPVGLITNQEVMLYGNFNSRMYSTGREWWTMSPNDYNALYTTSVMRTVGETGQYNTGDAYSTNTPDEYLDLRPVISLNQNAKIGTGDGSINNPYTIITD